MSYSILKKAAALALSKGNKQKNYQLSAICYRKDGGITYSNNSMTKTPNPFCHAESRVLRKADLGAFLYVARVLADGTWAMARPCKKCQAFIRNKGVAKVIYTIAPAEFGIWYPQKENIPK